MADSIHAASPALPACSARLARSARTAARFRGARWLPDCGFRLLLAIVFLKVALVKDLFLQAERRAARASRRRRRPAPALVFGYLGGGPAPFAVTEQSSLFILAVPRAAAGAGGERALGAALLLARAAGDRARAFVAAGEADARWRRGRPVDRGECLRRHGRGAALRPALPRARCRAASCSRS